MYRDGTKVVTTTRVNSYFVSSELYLSLARTPDDSVGYVFGAVAKSVMVTRCVIVVNLFLISERCLSELCNSGWCMYMYPFNQIYIINNIMYFMRT